VTNVDIVLGVVAIPFVWVYLDNSAVECECHIGETGAMRTDYQLCRVVLLSCQPKVVIFVEHNDVRLWEFGLKPRHEFSMVYQRARFSFATILYDNINTGLVLELGKPLSQMMPKYLHQEHDHRDMAHVEALYLSKARQSGRLCLATVGSAWIQ
jgi:hypothetical protein